MIEASDILSGDWLLSGNATLYHPMQHNTQDCRICKMLFEIKRLKEETWAGQSSLR